MCSVNGSEETIDVGFPSVWYEYVLLPLVNKEATLAYGRAECSKVGNPSRNRGGKKAESGRPHTLECLFKLLFGCLALQFKLS